MYFVHCVSSVSVLIYLSLCFNSESLVEVFYFVKMERTQFKNVVDHGKCWGLNICHLERSIEVFVLYDRADKGMGKE